MESFIKAIYVYCTDFIINLANIFDLSYYEVNTLIFCLLYPILVVGLISIYLIQKARLRKVKIKHNIR